MARRVPRLSTTFRRRGAADHETEFSPGHAYVRRVAGHNLWILYRFDDDHVFVMTARREPPVPVDENT